MRRYLSNISTYLFCMMACMLCFCCNNRYDWRITYEDNKKHVYGTYIVKKYLSNISSDSKSDIERKLSKYFDEENSRRGSYMFVGDAMLVDESDAAALTKFVSKGNQAVISAKVFPNTISSIIFSSCRGDVGQEEDTILGEGLGDMHKENFYEEEEEEVEYSEWEEEFDDNTIIELDSINIYGKDRWRRKDGEHLDYSSIGVREVLMNLNRDTVAYLETDTIFKTVQNGKHFYRNWYYLHDSLACVEHNNINVLGHLNDTLINFFEIPYGDGSFYIHTNPLVFTNVNMLNDTTSAYVLDVINKDAVNDWHWDEYSRTTEDMGMSRNRNNTLLSNKGPLTYILKQNELKWAWYSILAMGLLFLVFRAKRKQRVVPVLESNENTSLSFINTIGGLYFNKHDHKQLCKDQMQLWLEDVRYHYRINTSKLDEDFVELLAAKTKKPKKDISVLLEYYKNIDSSSFVSETTMITFYQKLNQFSIQTKL